MIAIGGNATAPLVVAAINHLYPFVGGTLLLCNRGLSRFGHRHSLCTDDHQPMFQYVKPLSLLGVMI